MDQILKANKQIIRQFMRDHYTDERLAMLLAHAQSGRLAYYSCCCFIGVATADHALMGANNMGAEHLRRAELLPNAICAEGAFVGLSLPSEDTTDAEEDDAASRRRLIPIIKAELRRRDRERQTISTEEYALTL